MIITVRPAPAEEIIARREFLEPLLKRATDRTEGSYEAIDILRQAAAKQVCLWLIEDGDELLAVAVTEMRQYPHKRVLEIPWLAGDGIEEWGRAFHDVMQKHKRDCLCDGITTVCGREGFVKVFQNLGIPVRKLGTVIALD